ncbi:hypothetical protein NL676_032289 [Syzygium grande]|nr:hypothetical protein NL676_032289 [Syzygium grande]
MFRLIEERHRRTEGARLKSDAAVNSPEIEEENRLTVPKSRLSGLEFKDIESDGFPGSLLFQVEDPATSPYVDLRLQLQLRRAGFFVDTAPDFPRTRPRTGFATVVKLINIESDGHPSDVHYQVWDILP